MNFCEYFPEDGFAEMAGERANEVNGFDVMISDGSDQCDDI